MNAHFAHVRGPGGHLARRIAAVLLLSVSALPVYAADLLVDTVSDSVDGDVSSPNALMARPGSDGISLREAIQATNNAPGPHTIGFADSLAGQTIALSSPLFATRDGMALTGFPGPDGQPAIVLDGRGMTIGLCCRAILFVHASDFTLTRLKFTGVTSIGIVVRAGETLFPPAAPRQVKNIRIEHNIFDSSGVEGAADAIRVWTDPEGVAVDATIANVRIAHNIFRHYTGSGGGGIIVSSTGTNCTIRDLVIQANTFDDIFSQLELASNRGSGNRIIGSRIVGNTFLNGGVPILMGHIGSDRGLPASENVIADTMIRGNVFSGNGDSLDITGGFTDGTLTSAFRNVVRDVEIANNLIVSGRGIHLTGGGQGSNSNSVEDVRIINNTVVTLPLAGLRIDVSRDGGVANVVTGVRVLNSIFRRRQPQATPEEEIAGQVSRDQVAYSVATRDFAGSNGNIADDPRFADPTRGDYRLQMGSPAIDAGTSQGAAERDLEGRERVDDTIAPNRGGGAVPYYDIGAFEFGGAAGAYLTVVRSDNEMGRVTSTPPGIDCGRQCWVAFTIGAEITLTPLPADGARFLRWSGDPECSDGVIPIQLATTCTAVFVSDR